MTGKRNISAQTIDRARSLRQATTFPERLLWGVLRGGRLDGLKFRRQEPIGQFVVDFCCYAARLIVEIDGRSHEGRQLADRRRTEFLERQGFQVVRFLNDQVLDDLEAVALSIARIARARAGIPADVKPARAAKGNGEGTGTWNGQ